MSVSSCKGVPCRRKTPKKIITSDHGGFTEVRPPATLLPSANIPSPELSSGRNNHFRRSPEEGTSSRKGCPRRSRRAYDIVTSAEDSFVGGQPAHPRPAPANILPKDEILLPEAQLRREARSPEEGTTSYKGCPRRSRRAHDDAHLR